MADNARQNTYKKNRSATIEHPEYGTSSIIKSVGDLFTKVTGPKKKYKEEELKKLKGRR